jgi:putative inorganic carbon (HCO3(-)) transporter
VRKLAHWIIRGELWFLLLIVPMLLFPNPLTPLGLVLVLVPWLCRWEVRGYPTMRTPADWPIVVMMLMTIVGLYPSVDLSVSLVVLCQVVAGVGLFYGMVNWTQSGRRVWQVVFLLMASGLALAMVAPLGTTWSRTKLFSVPHVYKQIPSPLLPYETINANVLAGALALIFPISMAMLLFAPFSFLSKRQAQLARAGLLIATLAMLAVVTLTQSRGSYLALAVGLLVMALLRRPELLWGTPLLLMGAGAVVRRFGLYSLVDTMLVTDSLNGLESRQQIWSAALSMLGHFPLTGIGLGTFDQILSSVYPLSALYDPKANIHHAHNLFLQVGVDLGLPGLCAFVALLVISLRAAWQIWRFRRGRDWEDVSALGLGLFTSLIVMSLHGVVDAVTWGTKPSVISWLVMGLSVAAYNLTKAENSELRRTVGDALLENTSSWRSGRCKTRVDEL